MEFALIKFMKFVMLYNKTMKTNSFVIAVMLCHDHMIQ